MWADPTLTAQQIADRLGLTKGMVIGKCRRVTGTTKPTTVRATKSAEEIAKIKAERAERNKERHRAKRETAPAAAEPSRASIPGVVQSAYKAKDEIIAEGTKTTAELGNRDCKWPIGEPGKPGFSHCGRAKPLDADIPYCAAHARVAYMPVQPRKDAVRPLKQWFGAKR